MVTNVENGHANRSPILDKSVCILHSVNGKGMNPTIFLQATGK